MRHEPVIVQLTAKVDQEFAVHVVIDGRRRHVQCGVVKRQVEVTSQWSSMQQSQQQTFT